MQKNKLNLRICGIHFLNPYKTVVSHLNQSRNKSNIGGGARERRRREPLGGCGGMVPQKILKSRGLEMAFPPIFQELFVIYASQQTNAP